MHDMAPLTGTSLRLSEVTRRITKGQLRLLPGRLTTLSSLLWSLAPQLVTEPVASLSLTRASTHSFPSQLLTTADLSKRVFPLLALPDRHPYDKAGKDKLRK